MNTLATRPADAGPIAADVLEQILGPFLTALETTLREVAQTEAAVRDTYCVRSIRLQSELLAMLDLASSNERRLVLGFAMTTAANLAQRMLAETQPNPDDALIRDCAGELVNVTAGQAKALLHGTPHQFSFSTPTVLAGPEAPAAESQCLVGVLSTDVGDVVLQLQLKSRDMGGGV